MWIVTSAFTDGMWTYDANVGDVVAAAATTAKDYVSPKNTSSFTQTVNSSIENGTVFYTQTLSLVLNQPVVADVVELTYLAKGSLAITVQANHDNYFVMGPTTVTELAEGP